MARRTLRNALALLQKEGLIRRPPHKGSFVCDPAGEQGKRILFIDANGDAEPIPSFTSYYTFAGVLQRCRQLGIECDHLDIRMVKNIQPQGYNYKGIILESPRITAYTEELALLKKSGLPMINVAGFVHTAEVCTFPCVFPDRRKAFLTGIEHLLRRGNKRIVFLLTRGWEFFPKRVALSEEEFFLLAKEMGIEVNDSSVAFCNNRSPEDMVRQTMELLRRNPRATAVFCDTDGIAAYAYEGIRKMGLNIPQDISVLGFSGCFANVLLKPGLSTVDFCYKETAAFAVDLLLRPDYPQLPQVIHSPFEMVMRESTSIVRYDP